MEQKEVMSVREISDYLGLSETIVRRLIKGNEIPVVKIMGSYRFYLPSVREWLSNGLNNRAEVSDETTAVKRAEEIYASVN